MNVCAIIAAALVVPTVTHTADTVGDAHVWSNPLASLSDPSFNSVISGGDPAPFTADSISRANLSNKYDLDGVLGSPIVFRRVPESTAEFGRSIKNPK